MNDRLHASDLEYHRKLCERHSETQAAIRLWLNHLSEKYGLAPGDEVTPEGELVRKGADATVAAATATAALAAVEGIG